MMLLTPEIITLFISHFSRNICIIKYQSIKICICDLYTNTYISIFLSIYEKYMEHKFDIFYSFEIDF